MHQIEPARGGRFHTGGDVLLLPDPGVWRPLEIPGGRVVSTRPGTLYLGPIVQGVRDGLHLLGISSSAAGAEQRHVMAQGDQLLSQIVYDLFPRSVTDRRDTPRNRREHGNA